MTLTVQLFARARELAGTGTIAIVLPNGGSVADLRAALVERVPALRDVLAVSRIAVNHDFAMDETSIREGDEVAVIPPVSGG